jgi:hypothetical protein
LRATLRGSREYGSGVHEEVEVQRLGLSKQVDMRCAVIGEQQHVGFVDGLESSNRGAVEREAFFEHTLVEERNRNREVLHDAWQVTEPDVDEFDFLILGQFDYVVGRFFGHRGALLRCELRTKCGR